MLPAAAQPEIHGSLCEPKLALAMFHLSVKPISRSAGRTATAAAAYRSGALIVDERTGELHDYTRKRDVVQEGSGIVVPPGSPVWAEDRAALWNAAEAAEKRKDARVARDYEVAIPKELTKEQGIELVRDFSAGLAERYGVAVDYNVHRDELKKWDGTEKGWQGYHAHVLTSTRKLGRDGFGDKAEIELSDTKRKGLGLGDGASEIERVRQMWEVAANRHLEQANQTQRIDRRSLKDQGIAREPTVHLGPGVTALERDGIPSRLGDINRQAEAQRTAQREIQRDKAPEAQKVKAREAETPKRKELERVLELEYPAYRPEARKTLAELAEIRDARVRQALARARLREARREEALKNPEAKYLERMERWDRTWEAIDKASARARELLEQAKQLAKRLVEASGVKQLVAWSHEFMRRHQPELVAPEVGEQPAATVPRSAAADKAVDIDFDRLTSSFRLEKPAADTTSPKPTSGRHADPGRAAVGDLKAQAAEGVAAFRARYEKTRHVQPAKTPADLALERLKAAVDAKRREQEAAVQKRKQNDRGQGHELPPRDKPKDGPDFER